MPDWIEEVNKLNKDNPLIIILGNKCDLENKVVSEKDRQNFSEMYGVEICEVSAKSSHNIESIMNKAGKLLIQREEKNNLMKDPKIEKSSKIKLGGNSLQKSLQLKAQNIKEKCNSCNI